MCKILFFLSKETERGKNKTKKKKNRNYLTVPSSSPPPASVCYVLAGYFLLLFFLFRRYYRWVGGGPWGLYVAACLVCRRYYFTHRHRAYYIKNVIHTRVYGVTMFYDELHIPTPSRK